MKRSTRDKLILFSGLLIIALYLSRNVIKEIFNPVRSANTKSGKQRNYSNDIIGKWSLDKERTVRYKEKPNYQMGGNIVEAGKYILTMLNTSELEFKSNDRYTHKITGNILFDTWIEGKWSIDDNKLELEETKNEGRYVRGNQNNMIDPPTKLLFNWNYRIIQLDSSSLVLLVHHRKPGYVSGHAMEINNGDTLFYKAQR